MSIFHRATITPTKEALISEMQHSVLGTRWVYDGLRDPQFVVLLAGVSMKGQGEALGMAVYEGRWYIAPSNVRIQGGRALTANAANESLGTLVDRGRGNPPAWRVRHHPRPADPGPIRRH